METIRQAQIGLNLDSTELQKKPGEMSWVMNGVIESYDGNSVTYANEGSNYECVQLPTGYRVVGARYIPQMNRSVFWLADSADGEGNSIIGYVEDDSCTFTTLIDDRGDPLNKIGLGTDYPIHQENIHTKITNCSSQVYWTDGHKPRYYVDFDDLPWKEIKDPTNDYINIKVVGELDANKLLVQPNFNVPEITPTSIDVGGKLQMGVYQFVLQYANALGEGYTSYYSVTGPVSIFEQKVGAQPDAETSKSIELFISGLDVTGLYDFFNLVVIRTINLVSTPLLLGTFPIVEPTFRYTYTGLEQNNSNIQLSLPEIVGKFPYYDTAEGQLELNGRVGWYNLKSYDEINYQQIASNIKLGWETWKVPYTQSEAYINGVNTALLKGYMRDEIYPFEIYFILKNGRQTKGFHIPGRTPTAYDRELIPISNPDNALSPSQCDAPEDKERWQVYNTGSLTGYSQEYLDYTATHDEECYEISTPVESIMGVNFHFTFNCITSQPIVNNSDPVPEWRMSILFYNEEYDVYYGYGYDQMDQSEVPLNTLFFPTLSSIPSPIDGFINPIGKQTVNGKEFFLRGDIHNPVKLNGNGDTCGNLFTEDTNLPIPIIWVKDTNPYPSNQGVFPGSGLPSNAGSTATTPGNYYRLFPSKYYKVFIKSSGCITPIASVNDGSDTSSNDNLFENGIPKVVNVAADCSQAPLVETVCIPDRCYVGPYQYGEFGYWESEEKYPNNQWIWNGIGAPSNQKIRHHKFPDSLITHIHDNNVTKDKSYEHSIYPIGIRVDMASLHQAIQSSSLSQHEKEQIVGFEIVRGDRSAGNKSVLAKGLVHNVGKYSFKTEEKYYPNYPYNDLRPDPFFVSEELRRTGKQQPGFRPDISLNGFGEHSRSRFVFHSPDTHFFQPTINTEGNLFKMETIEWGRSYGHFVEVDRNAQYKFLTSDTQIAAAGLGRAAGLNIGAGSFGSPTLNTGAIIPGYNAAIELFEKLAPFNNFGYSYHSYGLYDNYYSIPNEQYKIRQVDYNKYVFDGDNRVETGSTLNNYRRESSIYVHTDGNFKFANEYDPSIPEDQSRYKAQYPDLSRETIKPISAYYGSLKRELTNQWGRMYSYTTSQTGRRFQLYTSEGIQINSVPTIFGGDIFINRFALKTKTPLYLNWTVGVPEKYKDGQDIDYHSIGNYGYPMFWLSTKPTDFNIDLSDEIDDALAQMDASNIGNILGNIFTGGGLASFKAIELIAKVFREIYEKIGIKNINLDQSYVEGLIERGIHYLFIYGIPYFFVESEVNVDHRQAINETFGNFYPNVGGGIPDTWLQETITPIIHDNSYEYNQTYSKQANRENFIDHLREDYDPSKPCFTEHPNRVIYSERSNTEDTKNNWLIVKPSNRYDFSKANGKLVGLDSIKHDQVLARFENKSQIYNAMSTVDVKNGLQAYLGQPIFSDNVPPLDLTHTDGGHAGTQHRLLTKTEYGNIWVDAKRGQILLLKEDGLEILSNLNPQWFKNNLPFSTYDDNAYNSYGLTATYDNRYERYILTKKDSTSSWTISYNFKTKSWVSFHSYTPDYYLSYPTYFASGLDNSVWNHNLLYNSYQTFYNTLYPYVLEYPYIYQGSQDQILQSVRDYTSALLYTSPYTFSEPDSIIYFDEAWIYNRQQFSHLKLIPNQQGNLSLRFQYPKYTPLGVEVLLSKSDNFYQFNQIYNQQITADQPSLVQQGIDRVINTPNISYIQPIQKSNLRAKDSRIRLISNTNSLYKYISKFIIEETTPSYK